MRGFLKNKAKQSHSLVKRTVIYGLPLLLLLTMGANPGMEEDDRAIKTVVIDPGHGGKDSGCLGSKSQEKHIVLDISLLLGKRIKKNHPDVKVIYTRKTDTFITLRRRAQIANRNNADLFISVHCNANQSHRPYGSETYVMGLHKSKDNLQVAMRENAVMLMEEDHKEKYNNFNPKSPEAYIMFSMYQSAFMEQSITFASFVQDQFKQQDRKNRGVKQAGFWVLYRTSMPSVLVECGFLTNQKEEKYLRSEKGQKEAARAISKGFTRFKNRMKETVVRDNTSDDISFRVQILASSKPVDVDKPPYKKIRNRLESRKEDSLYRYLVGDYNKAAKAVNEKKRLHKKGFKGAFVVAYKGNKRIPFQEAISLKQAHNKPK